MRIRLILSSATTVAGYNEKQRKQAGKIKAVLQKIKERIAPLRIGLVKLSRSHGSRHPRVKKVQQAIRTLLQKQHAVERQLTVLRKAAGYGKKAKVKKAGPRKVTRLSPEVQHQLRMLERDPNAQSVKRKRGRPSKKPEPESDPFDKKDDYMPDDDHSYTSERHRGPTVIERDRDRKPRKERPDDEFDVMEPADIDVELETTQNPIKRHRLLKYKKANKHRWE